MKVLNHLAVVINILSIERRVSSQTSLKQTYSKCNHAALISTGT
jgi:hypothetical protein